MKMVFRGKGLWDGQGVVAKKGEGVTHVILSCEDSSLLLSGSLALVGARDDRRVVIVAKMDVAEKIDGQDSNRHLRWFDDAVDVDYRRETQPASPQRLKREEKVLIQANVGRDLVVGASGHGVDRFSKGSQRALIRQRDRYDHGHADGNAEDRQDGASLLLNHRTQHERAQQTQRVT